jgi:hypothetical protein
MMSESRIASCAIEEIGVVAGMIIVRACAADQTDRYRAAPIGSHGRTGCGGVETGSSGGGCVSGDAVGDGTGGVTLFAMRTTIFYLPNFEGVRDLFHPARAASNARQRAGRRQGEAAARQSATGLCRCAPIATPFARSGKTAGRGRRKARPQWRASQSTPADR